MDAVAAVLGSGLIARGVRVAEFEEAIASRLLVPGGIACSSGTAALRLGLAALGVGPGDEVVLPTYVCWNVLAAVTAMGAEPRLCDVDGSGVPTTDTVRPILSERTRAIVAVHIFGNPCDVNALLTLGIPVLEDACQAFGLELDGRPAGSLGTVGVLSFHATKCLTTGEGGMLVSGERQLLVKARALAQGSADRNASGLATMTDLQATLGLSQLARYDTFLSRRRDLQARYDETVAGIPALRRDERMSGAFRFRYAVRAGDGFELVQQAMLDRGVHVRRGVDELLHRRLGLDDSAFGTACRLYSETVSIPFHPSLTDEEIETVLRSLKEVLGDH